MKARLLKVLPEATLFVGLVTFLLGATSYFQANKTQYSNSVSKLGSTSITERQLAIDEAIRQGKNEYSYTTNFIPGLGRVGDNAEEYKKQLEAEAQKLRESNN